VERFHVRRKRHRVRRQKPLGNTKIHLGSGHSARNEHDAAERLTMKSKLSVALAATGCALALSIGVARADIITQTLSIPALPTTAFSTNPIDLFTNSFNQFNPSVGTLNSITGTISGDVVWTVHNAPGFLHVQFLTPNTAGQRICLPNSELLNVFC
jgi:hypothetical protein